MDQARLVDAKPCRGLIKVFDLAQGKVLVEMMGQKQGFSDGRLLGQLVRLTITRRSMDLLDVGGIFKIKAKEEGDSSVEMWIPDTEVWYPGRLPLNKIAYVLKVDILNRPGDFRDDLVF